MADCAENLPGLKHITEDAGHLVLNEMAVGEHPMCDEAGSARTGGAYGRENVGMSNHNLGENPGPRKPKGSFAMEISEGLGGPKAMAKAVVDGQSVNIPTHPYSPMEGRGFVDGAP